MGLTQGLTQGQLPCKQGQSADLLVCHKGELAQPRGQLLTGKSNGVGPFEWLFFPMLHKAADVAALCIPSSMSQALIMRAEKGCLPVIWYPAVTTPPPVC
eukprot:1157619-Pelagomonas_calceolata.AAC.16